MTPYYQAPSGAQLRTESENSLWTVTGSHDGTLCHSVTMSQDRRLMHFSAL